MPGYNTIRRNAAQLSSSPFAVILNEVKNLALLRVDSANDLASRIFKALRYNERTANRNSWNPRRDTSA